MKHTQKSLQNPAYKWQGEPVKVQFGIVFVRENEDKPIWWWNYECRGHDDGTGLKTCALIEAVKVIHSGGEFVIANHFGIGVSKLLKGGWPNHSHFSLPKEEFEAHGPTDLEVRLPFIIEFDEPGYANHESNRNNWQKKEYPEEYAKLEGLRRMLNKNDFTS